VGLSVTIEVGKQYGLHVRKRYYEKREHMTAIHWARYPQVAALPAAGTWLTIQSDLGLASTTIEAYGRALQDYLTVCCTQPIGPETATHAHIAAYVSDLTARPHRRGPNVIHLASGAGLANATIQQRLVTVRLFYDDLVEEGQREMNPVGRGRYTAGKGFGGRRDKGLVPRFTQLPWRPTEAQWQEIIHVARTEPIRNRISNSR
jgi:integrase/recombinase XerD